MGETQNRKSKSSKLKFPPANCRSIGVDRSAARRIAPTGLDVFAIFDDAGNRRIAGREGKHFLLTLLVVLRVVINVRDVVVLVIFTGFFAIRATRFCVNYQSHISTILTIKRKKSSRRIMATAQPSIETQMDCYGVKPRLAVK